MYETKAHYTKLAYDDIVAADIYFPTLTYTEFIELPTYQTIDFISKLNYVQNDYIDVGDGCWRRNM